MGLTYHIDFASYLEGWVRGGRDVVEGVGYPYVFKQHLVSGRVREKGMAVWDRQGNAGVLKVLWASQTWPLTD